MNRQVGVVIIGRNEGERLKRCLQSVLLQTDQVVYVDSGSSDGSVSFARSLGLEVVQLNMDVPFSASRARNKGFSHVLKTFVEIQYVQFVDGDCELDKNWLDSGRGYLENNPTCAIVAGRLKECFPEQTIYNRLCDLEWDAPLGDVKSCGGIFFARTVSFEQVNGFNQSVIAGEEPELCYRLRQCGWEIHRLGNLMALHDAGINRFSQWWRRAVRSGYAYAQGCDLHGSDSEHFRVKECARVWLWGFVFPVAIFAGVLFVGPWWLFSLVVYLIQVARVYAFSVKKIVDKKVALVQAIFTVIDKWPQLWGQLIFLVKKLARQKSIIIEYK